MHPKLLRGENHQERLTATLEMPNEALLRVTFHHSVHDLVGSEVLLIPANHLDAPVLLIRCEDGEALKNVQHYFGPEHAFHRGFNVMELSLFLVLLVAPGSPHINGHPDRPIAETFALGSE